jgi:class 3 adenylate cyclase/tetratricopeptide (TPR) repeat protein
VAESLLCPACGAANEEGRKFCGECGSALAQTCPSCGSPNPPTVKFCGECGTALTATPVAEPRDAPAAERRLVSILFADLVGFTAASEGRDAEDTRELLSRYFDTCRRLIELYGGTVEKFIGDAVMAVWGTPTATEDDAERAVRAALDLVAAVTALGDEVGLPGLRARAGVLTGEAAVTLGAEGQGMVAGDLVNTASRVQSIAEPGAVLVGEATRRATDHTIVFADAGSHELKGKVGLVPLWQALRVVSGARGALKSTGLEAPFVGRDRELRRIKDLFHACADEKRPQLISITGIAGIGKSRLAWEFYKYFDGLPQITYWHRGRCLSYGEGVTYWALADMVRMRARIVEDEEPDSALTKLAEVIDEHVPDAEERRFVEPQLRHLLGLEEGRFEREDLFAAWRLFFERLSDVYPTVLVFEDMQWADASLLDFIEYLLEWSRTCPLFVVTLARPELLERRPAWGAATRNFTSLFLEPLSGPVMEELLAGLVPGLPQALRNQILERAEGIPLYAVETVRMLLDRGALIQEDAVYRPTATIESLAVPETLHALIAARLDGLTGDERRVLQDGAVLGKTFTKQALGALSHLSEGDLDPTLASLVRKEVLGVQADPRSPEHGQYGFLQDLLRRVAYETLARADRKEKHLAAAAYLEGTASENELVEVIASHYLDAYEATPNTPDAAEIKEQARSALTRAGERAASLAAAEEAQRYFGQGAQLADEPLVQAALTDRAGQMAWLANKPDEARALLERADAVYAEHGDAVSSARVASRLADIDFVEGHLAAAAARVEPALAALQSAGSDADVAPVAAQLGRFLVFTGDYERAHPKLEQALALAESLDLPETFVQALNSKSVLVGKQGRPREERILVEGALAVALDHDLRAAALRAYNNLIAAMWYADDWAEEISNLGAGLELARRVGDRLWESQFIAGSVGVLVNLGRWDEALQRAKEAEELAAVEFARGLLLPAAIVYCRRGTHEEARALLTRHADVGRSENADFSGGYAAIEAVVLAAEGRPDEALEAIDCALAAHGHEHSVSPSWLRFTALDAAAEVADADKARSLLDELDVTTGPATGPSVLAQCSRLRARLPEHEAETEFATAERQFADLQAPFHLAAVQLEHGEWRAAHDRPRDAEPLLAEAREIFERLGARPWLERLEKVGGAEKVPA